MRRGSSCRAPTRAAGDAEGGPRVELATPADRWIFSRLAAVSAEAAALYDAYEFDDVARAALPLRVERGVRLVPGGGQDPPLQR